MLELIAIITMIIDHLGIVFYPDAMIFRIIGRLAFPMYAFFIAIGMTKTHNIKHYAFRLLILAIISQPLFYFTLHKSTLNICFTLLLGLLLILFLNSKKTDIFYKLLLFITVFFLTFIVDIDYGFYGLITIVLFTIKDKRYMFINQGLWTLICYFLNLISIYQLYAMIGVFLVYLFYENKNQKLLPHKLNYLIYPSQFIVILLLEKLLT